MPPKSKKQSESASVVEDGESSFSSVESVASGVSVSSEQLEKILEANHRSMVALIASLPTPPAASAVTPRMTQIKPPKWTEDETPFEYFVKKKKSNEAQWYRQKHLGPAAASLPCWQSPGSLCSGRFGLFRRL